MDQQWNGAERRQTNEDLLAVVHRLDKIEKILERMEQENKSSAIQDAEFRVRWEQMQKEHAKNTEHIKENWERINLLVSAPTARKATLWDTAVGKIAVVVLTAITASALARLPDIISLLLER
jgi:hypothetical protein